MRPCGRCRAPVLPQDSFFSAASGQVCRHCHLAEEVGAQEQRIYSNALELVGVPAIAAGGVASMAHEMIEGPPPHAPSCARCRTPSGVHVGALPPHQRQHVPPGYAFVCGRCWQPIR
jgi:hypothetical protein